MDCRLYEQCECCH
jgi:hypothetical protein